ncbi:MAG: XRE family transcriptional regulator [Candidatus Omnitrophota bacterium]
MLIGKRIRELRKLRKMKLIDLAEKTGIQIATLSRIEHERMTGTLASHLKIAKALSIELPELYQDVVNRSKAEPETITEKTPTQTFSFNEKAAYEILTPNVMSKKMMPIMMRLEAKGKTSPEVTSPGTERFVFVLKGKITVYVGEKTFPLKPNNSLYFDASIQHWFENSGEVPAKFMSISTPVAL